MIIRADVGAFVAAAVLLACAGLRIGLARTPENADIPVAALPPPHEISSTPRLRESVSNWSRPLFTSPLASASASAIDTALGTKPQKAETLPVLVGVLTSSVTRVAIFNDSGTLRRVRETETVGAWTVVKLEQRAALLRKNDQLKRLLLDPAMARPSASTPPDRHHVKTDSGAAPMSRRHAPAR